MGQVTWTRWALLPPTVGPIWTNSRCSKTIHTEQLCPVGPVPGRRRLLTVFESLGDDATGLCAANSNRSFPPDLRESCLVAKVY